jgi:hypothetical protein
VIYYLQFLRARWLTSLTPLRLFFVFFFFFYFLLFERRRFLEIWLAPGLFFLFFSSPDRIGTATDRFTTFPIIIGSFFFFFFFFPSSTVSPHMATDGRNFEKKKIKIPKLFSSDRNICPGWCPLRSGAVTHVLRARAGYPCKKKKKIFSVDIQVAPPKNGTRTAIDLIPYAK